MKRLTLFSLIFGLLLSAGNAQAARPTAFLKKQVKAVRALLAVKVEANTPEAAASDAKLMAFIEPVMDFPNMSQRALRKHWPALSDAQKAEFVELFRGLVFRSYLNRVRSADEAYTIAYESEEAKGPKNALVTAIAKTKKAEIELVFHLVKAKKLWVAEDIVIDEVSLTDNYREQFNKIIKKDGFLGLTKKMKDKLDKLGGPIAPAAAAAPASAAPPAPAAPAAPASTK